MDASDHPTACARCHRRTPAFSLRGQPLCLTHALTFRPMLRRSLLTALVVGVALTLINQGNAILADNPPADLYWKVPLTFAVPFLVATWGALSNSTIR
jgi:hypothetical protein